ncbi:protein RRP5 homolog [Caerostris extrusa]|uniref:Protein RRP5 homolog n=1 Tax=Caerostris extrusa TaxID=172846 RepID=A0AAV4QU72_CAEEX|nr:protein RRP5 homolog [Caerostris extrusa]
MNLTEFDPTNSKYEEAESVDEAEALVSTYPNSAKAWVIYMIYHLKLADVNKARYVVRRGIQTINYREDEEKLNLWKALMNLEAFHGSNESLFAVFEEALKFTDKKKTYLHMLNLLCTTEKAEEIEEFCQRIFKHLKADTDVYLTLLTYYMKAGKTKEARNLYSRSLKCIPVKEYPNIMGRFAQLEYKHGDIEKSLSLYEEILVKYPKRKDLKSVYINILKANGQEERANALL